MKSPRSSTNLSLLSALLIHYYLNHFLFLRICSGGIDLKNPLPLNNQALNGP